MQTMAQKRTMHDVLVAIQAGGTFALPFKLAQPGTGNAYWIWGHHYQALQVTLGPEHCFEPRVVGRGPFRGWFCCKLVFPPELVPSEAVTQAPVVLSVEEKEAFSKAVAHVRAWGATGRTTKGLQSIQDKLERGQLRTEGSAGKVVVEAAICPDDVDWSGFNPAVFSRASRGEDGYGDTSRCDVTNGCGQPFGADENWKSAGGSAWHEHCLADYRARYQADRRIRGLS